MKGLFITALLASVAMSQPQPNPVLTFDCSVMKEVCNNMCWGVHCTSGRFSKTLTSDNSAAKTVKDARRRAAGCLPNPNQCSNSAAGPNNGKGLNCDEFPFASTKEADLGGQNIRCVPSSENSKQGGAINAFYRSTATAAGTTYDIAFQSPNTAGVKYCVNPAQGNACVNDGNIFNKKVAAPDPAAFTPRKRSQIVNPMYLYRTKRGEEVSSATLFEIGRKLHTFVPRNATLDLTSLEGGLASMEGGDDDLELVMDEVTELIM
ncbi:hypothetical protein IFR05_014340 [Cadophora sp. M221]|nr:hypothetical protein IFR05_014340 [Cadophora sp. M221]